MNRLPASARIVTVKELTTLVKDILDSHPRTQNLWVRGELSNLRIPSSGHVYFTLKDEDTCLRCVMFRSQAARILFRPENGMQLVARGSLSVYERDGVYQLYVQELHADGVGDLHLAFQQLKSRLEQEGLFDTARKRRIPSLPQRIGLVTSPTGAAVRDLITVITRRFPQMDLVLAPASVQGESAPGEIAVAIERLNRLGKVDLIIVGRGGGSIEELWAFNTEAVARAIYHSRAPVISAVGHETDYTIADFVADLRAPTPSAAGELAVPLKSELDRTVEDLKNRLVQGLKRKIELQRERLKYLATTGAVTRAGQWLVRQQQYVDDLQRRLVVGQKNLWQECQSSLLSLEGKLEALSPLAVLKRGYAVCREEDTGEVILDSHQVSSGSPVRVMLARGELHCTVNTVKEEEPWQLGAVALERKAIN